MNQYYVYILSSKKNGTLYIGMTNNLIKRIYEHKNGVIDGFTKKYSVYRLVYFEQTNDVNVALKREKHLSFRLERSVMPESHREDALQ